MGRHRSSGKVLLYARTTVTLLACLLPVLTAACDGGGSSDPGPSPLPTAALQSMLDRNVAASTQVPGAVLAASRGGVQWIGAAGFADTSTHAPMDPALRFRIGSLTKQFTAALILKLAEEGKLTLDDTLHRWLPGLGVPYDTQITIRMLLNHTSGIPDYATAGFWNNLVFPNPHRAWQPTELVHLALQQPSVQPGTVYEYCNTGYVLAGMIAETASGESARDAMARRFFTPLGMNDTELATGTTLSGSYAHGYLRLPGSPDVNDVSGWNPSCAWAAGSVISTASDLLIWADALFGGRLLSQASLDAMLTPVAPSTSYGMGYGTSQAADGRTIYYHSGLIPGYSSIIGRHQESGLTIVVLTNREDISVETNDVLNPVFEGALSLVP